MKNKAYPKQSQPVGIFDSGVGGLTVARAVHQLLPGERIIYFGDTAHLPYGDKSAETVKRYALEITDFLLQQKCKLILIACNTASAAAYEAIKEQAEGEIPVVNVIDPVVEYAVNQKFKKIGIIGTKGTVKSKSYPEKIQKKDPAREVVSLATPLLAPMVEEGFISGKLTQTVIEQYLSTPEIQNIDALIPGCTHYPLLKDEINQFFSGKISLIDTPAVVAESVHQILKEKKLLNPLNKKSEHSFYVSDYTDFFEKLAKLFFGEEIILHKKRF